MKIFRISLPHFILMLVFVVGCAHIIPQAGPSTSAVLNQTEEDSLITLVSLDMKVASQIKAKGHTNMENYLRSFKAWKYQPVINSGDIVEVIIYEQSPAVLFVGISSTQAGVGISSFNVPPQVVDDEGFINIPFVGKVNVKGKKPESVAS
ncbi:MAG: polysaccharide biosynthesis/export family protein [Aquificaceae bacterium]|nr:polysaccharide biosynthesis/export family protein [Aquificaceae bacterium]